MSETNVTPTDVPVVRTDLPGPKSQALFDRLDPVDIGTLDHREVPFVEARKVDWMIEDVDGNTFADHCSAWGSTPLGATPEAVQRAVTEAQLRYGMEISNYVVSEPVVAWRSDWWRSRHPGSRGSRWGSAAPWSWKPA